MQIVKTGSVFPREKKIFTYTVRGHDSQNLTGKAPNAETKL